MNTTQIPKIIHLCWLSGDKYPKLIEACIHSWKQQLPDYEIKIWNKDTFDLSSIPFVKEAYENRKWAFAADYIRLYALYHYGGIYLDSDVFVFKSFDSLLDNDVFTAIEYCLSDGSFTTNIEAAVIGAKAGHPFIKSCLDYYEGRHFVKANGTFDQTILPQIIGDIAEREYGFIRKPIEQNLEGGIKILTPASIAHAHIETRSIKSCFAIHLCEGGWYERGKFSVLKRFRSLLLRFFKQPLKTTYMLYWNRVLQKLIYR